MKFGKKDNTLEADKSKAGKVKKAAGEPEKGTKKAKSAQRKLSIYLVYFMLAILIPISIAAFIADISTFGPAEKQAQQNQRVALANAAKMLIDQRLEELKKQVSGVATSPYMMNAIAAGTSEEQIMAGLSGLVPHAEKIVVVRKGRLTRNLPDGTTLSFAGLDMLKRVDEGESVFPEAFLQDENWLIQYASQVPGAAGDGHVGLILVMFKVGAIENLLKQLPGRSEIIQKMGTIAKPVLSGGKGDGAQESIALDGSNWTLVYSAAQHSESSFLDRGVFIATIAAGLIVSLVAVLLVFNLMAKRLRKDFVALTLYGQKLLTEGPQAAPQLTIDSLFTIAKNLEMVAKAQAKKAVKVVAEQPAKSTAAKSATKPAETAAPLFQESDALDLDMMDGDDDLLGMSGGDEAEDSGLASGSTAMFDGDDGLEISETASVDVPAGIFRAYDIRGIVGDSLSPEVVKHIGLAVGSEAAQRGLNAICVGYDGRLSSPQIAEALIAGINETGINVIEVGRVPTPVLYFATHQLNTGSGVMITGSHNPPNYNGFKMVLGGETLAGEAIQKLYNRIVLQDYVRGKGTTEHQDIRRDYLDAILNDIAVAAPLKVVVDSGNGIAGELGPMLIEELGCEVIPLHCDVDGNFPNHHPDPGKPENLEDLIEAVRREGADLGIAFDGDGDRIGVVTDEGKIIWPDRLLMLFAKDVVSRNPGADIIYDVKCSRRVGSLISEYGGRPVMWKTGHSLIKSKMKETGALLAGEMSGHIFFKERWYGFDDALYSAARLLEIVGLDERSTHEIFDTFPEDVSTPEINIHVTDENKFDLVAQLSTVGQFGDGSVTSIDGIRVDYADGWGLCRASNTTPVLVLRFEADTEEALERIKAVFRAQLARVDSSLEVGF
ncbi:MAG: phosphomannomutase/phosphoglucomutase [Hahellaceae bacterium]|nr:phosphomannomutase/phosphoglucomutase [Hahellaceae bacterium]